MLDLYVFGLGLAFGIWLATGKKSNFFTSVLFYPIGIALWVLE